MDVRYPDAGLRARGGDVVSMANEYESGKPLAWEAARKALSAAPSPTPTEQKQSDAERRWQFIRQNISPREAARLFHLADCQDHKPPEPDGEPCDIADWIDALTDAAMKSAGEKHE